MGRSTVVVIALAGILIGIQRCGAQSAGANPVCVPPNASTLHVTLRPQQTDLWCWAASAQMVMEYLGKSIAQCEQANLEFGLSNCCDRSVPSACIKGGWPQFDKYGFTFRKTTNAALPWPMVQSQLAPHAVNNTCASAPFAFTWRWFDDGGGHMMVATGYFTSATGRHYVFVNDPWEPNIGATKTITYEVYVELAGDHTHWDDYYDVR